MLHVIILLLKILLISLLALIGLVLLCIFAVLFVPFRYKVLAEHGEEVLDLDARVTWLLHLIRARIINMEGKFHIKVKFLFFTLYDNLKPRKPKEKKQRKSNIKNADNKSRRKKKEMHKKDLQKKELQAKRRTASGNQNRELVTKVKPDTGENNITSKVEAETKKVINLRPENTGQPEDFVKKEAEVKPEVRNNPVQLSKPAEKPSEKEILIGEKETDNSKQGKENIFEKILAKIKGFFVKIRMFFSGLRNKLAQFFDTAVNIKKKIGLISAFLKDKLNREGFQITYRSLKRVLRHIKPTKLRSRIVFGTGDPCSTGQALGVMGILYSFYGDKVQIIPDFENKIFEGKHYARGRIRLFTILIIVIKLILDKRFKQLRSNFQILKEAL